jgi:hypothetical protein
LLIPAKVDTSASATGRDPASGFEAAANQVAVGLVLREDAMRVKLPKQVAEIYRAVQELETNYPGRKFTPDGHLVGSIGEVIAAEALGLELYPASHPGHDARGADGCDVQIKLTSGRSVSLYSTCDRLVVLKIIDSEEAEIAYDGPANRLGQRLVSCKKTASARSDCPN